MGMILVNASDPMHCLLLEELGVRVYTAEELCYCMIRYPLLFLDDYPSEQVLEFLENGAGERMLAYQLREQKKAGMKPEDLILYTEEITGYLSRQESGQFQSRIQALRKLPAAEYLKQQADLLFSLRRYGKAAKLYERILKLPDGSGLTVNLKGRILNNQGCAYANLFMNDRACRAFEEAYALLKDNTIRKRIYFLSLTEPVIGLRERYSAAAGSDIPPEWDAEYEEARHRAAEGPRRGEIRGIFEKDPVRRQQGTAELIRRWKKEYRSML